MGDWQFFNLHFCSRRTLYVLKQKVQYCQNFTEITALSRNVFWESGRKGDLETTSKLEVRICGRMGANKGMSAAKINPKPVEVRHWMSGGGKGVKLQNIWGMWRRKSILEMNGRCTAWVEIAKWFKQVKWFEIVTCLRTLWIFSFFYYCRNFPC